MTKARLLALLSECEDFVTWIKEAVEDDDGLDEATMYADTLTERSAEVLRGMREYSFIGTPR